MACFLVLRGLKTLKLRMQHHAHNAQAIAGMLAAHQAVATVRYPYLAGTAQYDIARKQMTNGSAMMSFELKTGYDGAAPLARSAPII